MASEQENKVTSGRLVSADRTETFELHGEILKTLIDEGLHDRTFPAANNQQHQAKLILDAKQPAVTAMAIDNDTYQNIRNKILSIVFEVQDPPSEKCRSVAPSSAGPCPPLAELQRTGFRYLQFYDKGAINPSNNNKIRLAGYTTGNIMRRNNIRTNAAVYDDLFTQVLTLPKAAPSAHESAPFQYQQGGPHSAIREDLDYHQMYLLVVTDDALKNKNYDGFTKRKDWPSGTRLRRLQNKCLKDLGAWAKGHWTWRDARVANGPCPVEPLSREHVELIRLLGSGKDSSHWGVLSNHAYKLLKEAHLLFLLVDPVVPSLFWVGAGVYDAAPQASTPDIVDATADDDHGNLTQTPAPDSGDAMADVHYGNLTQTPAPGHVNAMADVHYSNLTQAIYPAPVAPMGNGISQGQPDPDPEPEPQQSWVDDSNIDPRLRNGSYTAPGN